MRCSNSVCSNADWSGELPYAIRVMEPIVGINRRITRLPKVVSVSADRRGENPYAAREMEPKVGIEPTAYALPRRCSTTELLGRATDGNKGFPIAQSGRPRA